MFFSYIHRSVFSPSFFSEVPQIGKRRIGVYLLQLTLIAALVSAMANTYYFFDKKRGIVAPLAAAFDGIEIRDGRLFSSRALPYQPPPEQVAAILNRLFGTLLMERNTTIPALVIDTSSAAPADSGRLTVIMGRTGITMHLPSGIVPTSVSYTDLLGGASGLRFTESEISGFVSRSSLLIFVWYCLLNGGFCVMTAFFCICILALAAYIFRFDRRRPIGYFFKLAGFAVTPIPLGVMLIAFSDVKVPGAWDVLVIVSFVIMFRALLAMLKADRAANAGRGKA